MINSRHVLFCKYVYTLVYILIASYSISCKNPHPWMPFAIVQATPRFVQCRDTSQKRWTNQVLRRILAGLASTDASLNGIVQECWYTKHPIITIFNRQTTIFGGTSLSNPNGYFRKSHVWTIGDCSVIFSRTLWDIKHHIDWHIDHQLAMIQRIICP